MRRSSLRFLYLHLIFLLIILINSENANALTGGNTGLTGLWEYPTAEIPDDGTGRFGYTKATPYGYYFLDLAWLPWLEINARFDTFNTLRANSDPDGRRYMDKAIDLKAVLWRSRDPSKWYIPSIAGGVVDMMGTELMKAWWGAATWRWGSVAATIGYGTDRLNGLYGGLEWDIADWLTVKAEYSPLDYAHDIVGRRTVIDSDDMPSKKYNVGLVFKAPWGMQGSVSYQRGNEWVFSISQRIDLAGPFLGKNRKNFNAPGDSRVSNWDDIDADKLIAKIKSGLEKYVRVRDVDIKFEDTEENQHKLSLAYENYGYSSHAEAMARILVVLSAVMPETDELVLIHKNAGIPVVQATFPGSLLFDIRARSLRGEDSIHSAVFEWAGKGIEDPDETGMFKKRAQHELKAMLVYEPRIDQTLWDTYMDRWDIDLIYKGRYSKGWGGIIDIKFPIHTHANTANYRGLWWEKDFNDKIRIQQAGATYANKVGKSNRAWFFGEGGWLDEEWFGANFWARYYGKDGLWWIGARASALHDRDPYSFAGLTEGRYRYLPGRTRDIKDDHEWRHAEWLQAGYHMLDLDVDVTAEYGRFADNDKGYKIEVIRHWDDTALGFWYIDTDVHAPNKGFTKAGVHMEIPAEKWFGTWFGNSSSHIWEQDTLFLSTWEVESGREGGSIRTPERMMNQLRPVALKKNVEKLLHEYCSYDEEDNSENTREVKSLLEYIFH